MSQWIGVLGLATIAIGTIASAQQPAAPAALPLEPARERGASITPAFEGWYSNADGTSTILLGYYNRNSRQTLEIPIGPNNRIEPGDPDQGQPTYFQTGRQWGVFTIKVPKDFGTKTLTWTIVSNGEKQSIPFSLNKAYTITPLKEIAMGNQPPVLWFAEGGTKFTGPPTAVAATLTGAAKQPVPIKVWAEDPKGLEQGSGGRGGSANFAAQVSLHKYRGPGQVTFEKARQSIAKQGEVFATTATFSEPGNYTLRVQANDESGEGGGGFQCCWTNTYLKVTIQ